MSVSTNRSVLPQRRQMTCRVFLAIVALLYFGLAVWCTISPIKTAEKVGFTLNGDSGRSEFVTVYGGLEFGWALVLLIPLLDRKATRFSLLACALIHGSLVVFRSGTIFIYADVSPMTIKLSVGEWIIFVLSVALLVLTRSSPENA